MRGQLKLNGVLTDTYELTIYDIVKHFENIVNIEFTPGEKTNSDYFDLVRKVFQKSEISTDKEDKVLMPVFYEKILKLFSNNDVEIKSKLKELGATDIDFALITGDIASIKSLASENLETDIYKLAKDYRFIDMSRSIHPSLKFAEIDIRVADSNTFLGMLIHLAFVHDKNIPEPHNALINIEDDGGETWDYNTSALWNSYLKDFFDISILYGNGSTFLLERLVDTFFKTPEMTRLAEKNLDFALVLINMHDDMYIGKLISVFEKFPQLAKETLYVVHTCYSGKYHKILPNGCHLITSSSAEETSRASSINNLVNLPKYISKSGPDLKSFLKFYANEYGNEEFMKSTPHFSGIVEGTLIEYKPVKEITESFTIEQSDEEHEELNTVRLTTNESVHVFSPLSVTSVEKHEASINLTGDDSPYAVPDYDSIPHYGLCSLM